VSPALLFFGGFLIAVLASIFGVGGGFLIVPFLTDGIGIPVFLAAGISMLVVLISSITSVSNYLRMGIHVVVLILLVELAGIIVDSRLGPKISKHLNDKALKYSLMVLLAFIGVYYVFKP
jgi:Sulfite exporter TauE/SafE.